MVLGGHEDGRNARDFVWDDPTFIDGSSTINQAILSAKVNYSMDMVSEITLEVLDHENTLARANYFSIGRHVWYRAYTTRELSSINPTGLVQVVGQGQRIWQKFEIASVTMGPGPGVNPVWNLRLRPSACQQMKRNRRVDSVKGVGRNLIYNAAKEYGLACIAQGTHARPGEGTEWQSKSDDHGVNESLWDVMKRTAAVDRADDGHTQFMLFEADGILFFGSQKWLLGRWGITYDNPDIGLIDPEGLIAGGGATAYNYIELNWPSRRHSNNPDNFQLMAMPTCSRSDNAPMATEGSAQLDRLNGRQLRPGMTIFLRFDRGVGSKGHYFQGMYLITSVSFEHIGNGTVSINFRSPERLAKDIKILEEGPTSKQFAGSYSEI